MNAYQLTEAVWQRLKGQPGFDAHDGQVLASVEGRAYVVLHRGAGQTSPDRLADPGLHRLQIAFYVTVVGWSPAQTTNTAELVRTLLTGWRPDPTSRACSPLRESDTGTAVARDDDAQSGPARFWLPIRYTTVTHRS